MNLRIPTTIENRAAIIHIITDITDIMMITMRTAITTDIIKVKAITKIIITITDGKKQAAAS